MTVRLGRERKFSFALAATLLLAPLTAHSAEQSGITVAVIPAAQAVGEAGKRRLQPQAPVFMGDVIATGPSGEAQVQLLDQTKLVVGPNSRLEIDSFVYSGNGTAQQVSLNAVRGAFRFITGNSQKTAYNIRTPTATIGVRGTEFDFNVDTAGGMQMALYDGWARICEPQRRQRCVDVWGACTVAVAPPGQRAKRVTGIDDRKKQLEAFRYLASQANLRPAFRVDTSSCGTRRAGGGPGGGPVQNVSLPPAGEQPQPEPQGSSNRSGLADNSNPGQGSGRSNSPNSGENNPTGPN